MTSRPSPLQMDPNDYWVVCEAASRLTKQACTLAAMHIKDGVVRTQFNREIAYYAKRIADDVADGKKTPDEALLEIRNEQRSLIDQSLEIGRKGAGVIAGVFQVAAGATICASPAIVLCGLAGLPMIAHGANNIYENGENLLTGRSDSEGWVRKGYQAAATSMGGSTRDGNIAYGVSDIGLSVYGMTRMVLRTGAWKLFKYIPSDYVRSYINMSRGAIVFEVGVDMLTGEQVYVETKK
ncbi:DUF4225 domain-containing protein [Pseudomonas sp. BBP2017]|uniref:DUF4225 domain-containing protein n=1 Tax=Pseudomonas sp. BBP2017 TaxID=2109731 RepID=UPI000D12D21E|nr:DUF4225 domain-containing protein [Pseudomonas sp. BBP2017]PSS57689.1 hypothetical protein C6382_07265 [Pseudomonas sp. BBP2017]